MEKLEFSQQVWLTLIVGGLTLLASLITGAITFLTAVRLRDVEKNKRDLFRAYRDIAAFHRLEECYAAELAQVSGSRTAESWKRELRRRLREQGFGSPSDKATARHAETRIEEIG